MYPQYQFLVPREGEEGGGGFWQTIVNYFGGCGEGGEGGAYFRRIIPPTIDTKIPEGDTEKQGPPTKEDGIDRKPSKPFYYVLPPSPGFNYYFPQPNLFNPPNVAPKYITTNSFRVATAKSLGDEVVSKTNEINTKIPMSNGHANEKNVNK